MKTKIIFWSGFVLLIGCAIWAILYAILTGGRILIEPVVGTWLCTGLLWWASHRRAKERRQQEVLDPKQIKVDTSDPRVGQVAVHTPTGIAGTVKHVMKHEDGGEAITTVSATGVGAGDEAKNFIIGEKKQS